MSTDSQGTEWRRKIGETFNRLSRAHERYRQKTDRTTTDGRAIARTWTWVHVRGKPGKIPEFRYL